MIFFSLENRKIHIKGEKEIKRMLFLWRLLRQNTKTRHVITFETQAVQSHVNKK
jgi:hypothetical protein